MHDLALVLCHLGFSIILAVWIILLTWHQKSFGLISWLISPGLNLLIRAMHRFWSSFSKFIMCCPFLRSTSTNSISKKKSTAGVGIVFILKCTTHGIQQSEFAFLSSARFPVITTSFYFLLFCSSVQSFEQYITSSFLIWRRSLSFLRMGCYVQGPWAGQLDVGDQGHQCVLLCNSGYAW